MFSDHTLEEIRARLSIVELVGEYVPLKKSGQSHTGLCPFHKEKTPSFHVHSAKGCFHCFGCHKGGNLFSFYSSIEGISFPEAVRKLAERAGVTLEEVRTNKPLSRPTGNQPSTEKDKEANAFAAKFFHDLLLKSREYEFARTYLKSRGISKATAQKFRIGVAPRGWATLVGGMTQSGFTIPDLVHAGLMIQKENSPNGGYDRFRERLMFPIFSADGTVVGFGARLLTKDDQQPKYINSPESDLFSKRTLLYGLHENQRHIRLQGEAVIVEGYMDVVGLYEKGVQNAVATMGTALTEEHCRLIKSHSRRIVTVFDPDAAGTEAWHRSVHIMLEAGILARDLTLPESLDPDEYAAKYGSEKFYEACKGAPRQLTKLLKEISSRGSLSEEERGKILEKLTPVLVATRNSPDRYVFWDNIALVLQLSMDSLVSLVEQQSGRRGQPTSNSARAPLKSPQKVGKLANKPSLDRLEIQFWEAALADPKGFLSLPAEKWQAHLREPKLIRWLEKLATSVSPKEFTDFTEQLTAQENDPVLLSQASRSLMATETSKTTNNLEAVLVQLHKRTKENQIKTLSLGVKLSSKAGDETEGFRLLKEIELLRAPQARSEPEA